MKILVSATTEMTGPEVSLSRERVTIGTVLGVGILNSGVEVPDLWEFGLDGEPIIGLVASDVAGRTTETLVTTVVVTTTGEDPVIDV